MKILDRMPVYKDEGDGGPDHHEGTETSERRDTGNDGANFHRFFSKGFHFLKEFGGSDVCK